MLSGEGGGGVNLSKFENSGGNEGLPVTRPFSMSVFEDLEHGRADVVFRVQPREGLVRVERGGPAKTAVGLEFHAEERVVKTGKVVVVDAGVDKRGGQPNLLKDQMLSQHSLSPRLLRTDVILDL